MSSMGKKTLTALFCTTAASLAFPAAVSAQDGASWDAARTSMVAQQPGRIAQAVDRWEYLIARDNLSFGDYANFITTYPGFPQQARLQQRAENALDRDTVSPGTLIAFFDRNPPITNGARARYALALAAQNRSLHAGHVRFALFPRRSRCADGCAALAGRTGSRRKAGRARLPGISRSCDGAARAASGQPAERCRSPDPARCPRR